MVAKETVWAEDVKTYNRFEEKGLISIKSLVMKNPEKRSKQEETFLILFLKIKHQNIFKDFDKDTLSLFVKRLSVQVYKPGNIVCKQQELCQNMIFVMEGLLETTSL